MAQADDSDRSGPRRRPVGLGKRAWITTHLVRRLLRFLAWSRFVRVTVVNREVVPAKGPVLIASNHISMLDAIFLWGALRRRAMAVAMAELWSWPLVGSLVRRLGHIPVVRRNAESGRRAIDDGTWILRHGGVLLIYPEGRCVPPGQSEPYKPGVAELALATGVPIIPVATIGTDGVLPLRTPAREGRRFDRSHPVTIRFGEPIDPGEFDSADELLDHLRTRIEMMRTDSE
ncbi:lysophospholipid acyltransferase family protein [Nocardia sp. NPDC005366]|uniref:lysophospholipid acyltransferase family protein n=1 Tax=Nocardia sp. NPDC005366 TaxID=3156878 RepID=UPI0033BE567D